MPDARSGPRLGIEARLPRLAAAATPGRAHQAIAPRPAPAPAPVPPLPKKQGRGENAPKKKKEKGPFIPLAGVRPGPRLCL